MRHSDQGIKKERGEEQPADKERAQTVHKTDPRKKPVSREATRDPKLSDGEKTPGSGMTADDEGDAPTG